MMLLVMFVAEFLVLKQLLLEIAPFWLDYWALDCGVWGERDACWDFLAACVGLGA